MDPNFTLISAATLHTPLCTTRRGPIAAMPLDTALHKSAKDGDVQECLEALRSGVAVNAPGAQGRTALHRALGGGFSECARTLIASGADPLISDAMKRTALHWAVLGTGNGVMACVELLFAADLVPQMVNVPSKSKSTPLHCAISAGREDIAVLLLQKGGADPNLLDEDDKSCRALAKAAGMKLFDREVTALRRSSSSASSGSGGSTKRSSADGGTKRGFFNMRRSSRRSAPAKEDWVKL